MPKSNSFAQALASLGAVCAISLVAFTDSTAMAQTGAEANDGTIAATAASPPSAPGRTASTAGDAAGTGEAAPALSARPGDVPIGTELSPEEFERLKRQAETQPTTAAGAAGPLDEAGAALQMDPGGGTQAQAPVEPDAPRLLSNFTGIPATGWLPPDPIMAVGPSDLVVAVNSTWRIYSKSGTQIFNQTFDQWFSNVLPANRTDISVFDPWVIYDQVGGRFILLALARRNSDQFSRFLISVSDNNTAAGRWCNYSLDARVNGSTNTTNWADYAKIGVTNNAVVISANMFNFPTSTTPQSFQYVKMRFLSKSTLYNTNCPGQAWRDFWDLRNADNVRAFTVQPTHSYMLSNTGHGINSSSGGGNRLTLWRYTTTTASPPGVTLVRQATLPVASYSFGPNAEQRDSTTRINTGDARLLNAIHHGSGLWTTHTVGCNWSGDSTTRNCIRWYQINPSTNAVIQQGTFGSPRTHYFFPAVTANAEGNMTVVFSYSGPSLYAGIRYTGRRPADARGTLQGSGLLRAGEDCYVALDTVNRNRWGDYNGIALDPSFSNRAWFFSEYAFGPTAGCSSTWRTHIGHATW